MLKRIRSVRFFFIVPMVFSILLGAFFATSLLAPAAQAQDPCPPPQVVCKDAQNCMEYGCIIRDLTCWCMVAGPNCESKVCVNPSGQD
jgi:hypothetical protein